MLIQENVNFIGGFSSQWPNKNGQIKWPNNQIGKGSTAKQKKQKEIFFSRTYKNCQGKRFRCQQERKNEKEKEQKLKGLIPDVGTTAASSTGRAQLSRFLHSRCLQQSLVDVTSS